MPSIVRRLEPARILSGATPTSDSPPASLFKTHILFGATLELPIAAKQDVAVPAVHRPPESVPPNTLPARGLLFR